MYEEKKKLYSNELKSSSRIKKIQYQYLIPAFISKSRAA